MRDLFAPGGLPAQRPDEPTPELVDEILARVSAGATLRQIAVDPAMPTVRAMTAWVSRDQTLARRYREALRFRAELYVDETLEIADSDVAIAAPQAARLRVDTRKWVASKLDPTRYGDRVEVEHTGSVELPSDLELARRIAFLLDSGVRVIDMEPGTQ